MSVPPPPPRLFVFVPPFIRQVFRGSISSLSVCDSEVGETEDCSTVGSLEPVRCMDESECEQGRRDTLIRVVVGQVFSSFFLLTREKQKKLKNHIKNLLVCTYDK